MACTTEWGTLLSKYVDGESTADERHLVDSHTSGCATCKNTLGLFSRNEKVLESSLAGEAFGDLIVDEVMAEIRRLETPPIVAPALDGKRSPWIRLRRLWPAAAAAATLLLSIGAVIALRGPDYGEKIDMLLVQLHDAGLAADEAYQHSSKLQREVEDFKRGPNRVYWAYVAQSKTIAVRATFAIAHERYEIERSQDEGKTWTTLATDLKQPYFEDKTALEGTTYDYRYIGHGKEGRVEAAPVRMRLAISGGLDPQASLRITLRGTSQDRRTAWFELERSVDGQPIVERFTVRLGQTLGDTNLVLDRVDEQDQVSYWGGGAITRLNKIARLRAAGGGQTLDIWRYDSKLVPLPK